jgi:DUF1365 family protein
MSKNSAIYLGDVRHARYRPRKHKLNYRVFSFLLDLDELADLDKNSRVFGYNRRAIFSFRDEDHGNGRPGELRQWVEDRLHQAGLPDQHMKIHILCYPRIFGYVFNPMTTYFCYGPDDELQAILYEVSNTYGERHTYVIPVAAGTTGRIRQSCAKDFYVSPFMPMSCTYHFQIEPPGDKLLLRIDLSDLEGPLFVATFAGKRQPFTDSILLRIFFSYPLMTLKVTLGIHWEALRLWLKGNPVYRHKDALRPVDSSIIKDDATAGKPH